MHRIGHSRSSDSLFTVFFSILSFSFSLLPTSRTLRRTIERNRTNHTQRRQGRRRQKRAVTPVGDALPTTASQRDTLTRTRTPATVRRSRETARVPPCFIVKGVRGGGNAGYVGDAQARTNAVISF